METIFRPDASPTRLAIVGGGPGGLMLARLLRRRGLAATVFEYDLSPSERPQGGSLDLHEESGLLAIREAGLQAEFFRHARPDDQGLRLLNAAGEVLLDQPQSEADSRPEIDRTVLRQILLESIPARSIRWGHKLKAVHPLGNGTHELEFHNGARGVFDFVVGADGAWSRVRRLLSPVQPIYSGITFVELELNHVDAKHPEIAELVGRGKMFAVGRSQTIIAQRNGHGVIRVYLALRRDERWAKEGPVDFTSPVRANRALTAAFAHWARELRELIEEAGDRIVPQPIYSLPAGFSWKHRPGVTLLGDAAHLMTPFGGEGVNLAMLDAVDLAEALTAPSAAERSRALEDYEAKICCRAAELSKGAAQALDETVSDDGLAHVMRHFLEIGAAS